MRSCIPFFVVFVIPLAVFGQESSRDLTGPGDNGKYLTPGQTDEWNFDGEKDETIIAHVATKSFDSILGLAVKGEKTDKLLFEYDDEGSDSRFAFRLPAKAHYKILVHAYMYRGGGNYNLTFQRFHAVPLELGKPVVGTFDHAGQSYYYFPGVKDTILTTDVTGASSDSWKMLDNKGRDMQGWGSAVTVEENGEHYLVLSGRPGARYDLIVRPARQHELAIGNTTIQPLIAQGEMDVWSFSGKPGDFRVITFDRKNSLAARLIYAPLDKKHEKRLSEDDNTPELRFVPTSSFASHVQYVAVLGRTGRYQLQLLATAKERYLITMSDPTAPIRQGETLVDKLPVAGTAFYSFTASPGQFIHAYLGSKTFVPLLRLYDSMGVLLYTTDGRNDGDDLESSIGHIITREGLYRLQVSSVGDGGGGDYRIGLQETKLKELALGGRSQGTIYANSPQYWTFAGKEGQTVFLHARSAVCEPEATLLSPDGVELISESHGSAETGTLLACKLPKTGRYTVAITSRRGDGEYTVRLIDGD